MSVNDTKAVKSYFRNSPNYGRCTQLVETKSGRVLLEVMGIATRKQLFKQYTDSIS